MKVRQDDVAAVLDAVIQGRLERDSAEAWAQRRLDLLDDGGLVFEPPEAEDRLYEAIQFIQTVARRRDDGGMVHSPRDVASFRARLGA